MGDAMSTIAKYEEKIKIAEAVIRKSRAAEKEDFSNIKSFRPFDIAIMLLSKYGERCFTTDVFNSAFKDYQLLYMHNSDVVKGSAFLHSIMRELLLGNAFVRLDMETTRSEMLDISSTLHACLIHDDGLTLESNFQMALMDLMERYPVVDDLIRCFYRASLLEMADEKLTS